MPDTETCSNADSQSYELRIAITGHRTNRLTRDIHSLRGQITQFFSDTGLLLSRQSQDARIWAISALAAGADQEFAESALNAGVLLEAILPMAHQDYRRTFQDVDAIARLDRLLLRANRTRVLAGSPTHGTEAFERLGETLASSADILLAIWDGLPPRGPGGTATVIDLALAADIPVAWITATAQEQLAPNRWITDRSALQTVVYQGIQDPILASVIRRVVHDG